MVQLWSLGSVGNFCVHSGTGEVIGLQQGTWTLVYRDQVAWLWCDAGEPQPFSTMAEKSLHVQFGENGVEAKRWLQHKTSSSELVAEKLSAITVHAWSPSTDLAGPVNLRVYWHALPKGALASASWAFWSIPALQNMLYASGSLSASLRKERVKTWREKVTWLLDVPVDTHCRMRGQDSGKHSES
eukprot:4630047-Amphidinium_carterae.1